MAGLDWAATKLGPVRDWPHSLRSAVRIVLSSRYPMLLLWGPDLTQLYNDAYSALIGAKHPAALGLDVRITLAEGWDVLRPLIAEAMATGVASWVPALQLLLDRAGYREEAYFSVSHAPARDDRGATVGVLTVCSEVTEQVVGERRLRLLRDLAVPAGDGPAGVRQTCARLCQVIGEHPLDVPFAAVYLRDGPVLRRCAVVGADASALPPEVVLGATGDDPWHLRAAAGGSTAAMADVAERLTITGGPWHDPVRTAVARPLPSADLSQPVGVLLTGLSPARALDETYRSFLHLLAQQVAVAVRNAQAYQEERDRAAALAELDRVKTDFFTNVSHELRTPLTLMLGPLADALADRAEPLGAAQRERVDTAWRNAGRLLTLVNELLTFSSIGTGQARTAPRALDLAGFTAELAGVFRAAVERTGLRLVVDCPPLPGPVAVDPGHWEKIVTNLLSNALKFTFVGEIRVGLESDASTIRLSVSDTGIGIDQDELPRLFDRFHRVRGARSRSHEGTGIGLALVRELARLQGGDVEVRSVPGKGSTFTVALPWAAVEATGAPALPTAPEQLADARAVASVTTGWTAGTGDERADAPADPAGIRILVADDNRDMRQYLSRLLTAQGWRVETAADGEAALQAIRRHRPDLLLTDVMMPRLDGFALVRALREDEATRSLPVVMLSARAGHESGVEGLTAGADDYVVKPFSADQLIARIRTTLKLAGVRAAHVRQPLPPADTADVIASGQALRDAFQAATERVRALLGGVAAVTVLDGAGHRPPLRFHAPPDPTAGPGDAATSPGDAATSPGDAATIEAEIRTRDGARIGAVSVVAGAAGPSRAVLASTAELLGSLAHGVWRPDHDRQLALGLHRGLLPEELPTLDGWDVHAGYRPARSGAAGGWYDIARTADGRLLISLGTVPGHGLDPVLAAGQIRGAVRAYAAAGLDPARIADRLATVLDRPDGRVALLVGVADPATGRFTWCGAGHPGPVHAAPGEPARTLPTAGPAPGPYRTGEILLAPGGQLLFCTAAAGAGPRLARHCDAQLAASAPVSSLVDAVLADEPAPDAGDVAVAAIRRRPEPAAAAGDLPELDVTWTYPVDPGAAGAARRDLKAALRGDAMDPDLLYDLQVAATEAINNAVEHAQRPSRPEIRVRLLVTGGLVRIEVQDFGGWRARPPARDRGRGAILMNAYGDVRLVTTATGTLVTIERRWAAPPPGSAT
ncbi:signal transduction histidine kinase [Actinoplanes teichomyceticus]|uniref:histidine kinase n=2 Tax=Actinoplanes teichomyceticus TaxID=1867 RepID=A0A561VCT5_ACTTI|nr:signal transduction histidine kinase [Actinoplanes teichomyceticus]